MNSTNPNVINHLGIIPDGNRRWAKANNLSTFDGHKQGIETLKQIALYCLEEKVRFLTVYTLSAENLANRSKSELEDLFFLIKQLFNTDLISFCTDKIKVLIIGDPNLFPPDLAPTINDLQEKTKNNVGLTLSFLFCYGGKQEILQAASSDNFEKSLWSKELPELDLIIRTGGQKRLSNFLPWQSSYAELAFLEIMWPEFNLKALREVFYNFSQCTKNFGA